MTYRKKLIEVALPLKAINEASAREKSIRHGHPSTLHLWWARRPLAACRAVLFASLVDDPDSDPMYEGAGEEITGAKRAELFNLIEELVRWENSNNPRVINRARAEIARSIAANKVADGEWTNDTVLELSCGAGVPPAEPCSVAVPAAEISGVAVPAAEISGVAVPAAGVSGSAEKRAGGTRAPQADKAEKAGGTPTPQTQRISCSVRDVKNMLAPPEAVNAFLADHAPPVLDPFCGGGSIPLEAQRLGLRAYASDLNPVPVLITKALIEIPPKFAGQPPVNPEWQRKSAEEKAAKVWQGAQGLAEDVRYYGKWMRDEAFKRIGHLYPKVKITADMAQDRPDLKEYVGQELTVIAWLWARTVASPNPAANGAEIPLVRSFSLSSKKGSEAYIDPLIDRRSNALSFRVRVGVPDNDFDPRKGTVARTGARCLLTGAPVSFDHIRTEAQSQRMGSRLMAIIAEGEGGRVYLSPSAEHVETARSAEPSHFPDSNLPEQALGFRVQLYGMDKHSKLFTRRQLLAISELSGLVAEARCRVLADAREHHSVTGDDETLEGGGSGAVAYADAVATYLAFGIDKVAEGSTTLCTWSPLPTKLHVVSTFGRQSLPMVWDYAEANVFANSSGNFERMVGLISQVLERLYTSRDSIGRCWQFDATAAFAPVGRVTFSTDPPYYDNIGYADLSDFSYVWLRCSLGSVYPNLFATLLTPKAQELIATPYRHGGDKQAAKEHFETGLNKTFFRMRESLAADIPLTIFYAFKQSEENDDDTESSDASTSVTSTGWETMLDAVSRSGFVVDGTWPMRTERAGGFRNLNQNALASSIILVCRPRPDDAPLARRKDFMNALRAELPEALRNLQHGNIAPVDLAQAAIGPGMAVFTRYAKVVEADGSAMSVRTALGIINQVLDEVLAEQEGDFDPDTRWALAWFAEYGMNDGPFGIAETLSKAKNTAVAGLVEAGVVKARAGKVKLVGRDDLPDDWDPGADGRLTVWETAQHLIRALESEGESGAAALLARLGGIGETARELAYRLYTLCERKKWAEEALAYNGLVIAWPELAKLALAHRTRTAETQGEMF